MKVYYGADVDYRDVTPKLVLYGKYIHETKFWLTPELRCKLFDDHLEGINKFVIFIQNEVILRVVSNTTNVFVDLTQFDDSIVSTTGQELGEVEKKLRLLHRDILLFDSNMLHEYPEQVMSCKYVRPEDRVLEIGSNVGRNSFVISRILNNERNLITLESDEAAYNLLLKNMEINNSTFHAVNAALSRRKLGQNKGFVRPFHSILESDKKEWTPVTNILLEAIRELVDYNVIVADCEGSMGYIVDEFPDIFKNVRLFIIENDYWDNPDDKEKVDAKLHEEGFICIEKVAGGVGRYYANFYEAWTRF